MEPATSGCHYENFIEHLASIADMAAFNKTELDAFKKSEQNAAKQRAAEAGIGNYEWKLEQDGFRVATFEEPQALAEEVYAWARPALA